MMFKLSQLPTFNRTITLLHKTGEGYTRSVIHNCSIYKVDVLHNNGINTSTEQKRAVDIPCPVDVAEGDYIFEGDVQIDVGEIIKAAREHKGLKVHTISRNDRINIGQHIHCEECESRSRA